MRRTLPLLCGAVLSGLSGVAMPVVRGQVAPPVPATAGASVLVLPFAMQAGGGSGWIGRAVQQDLFTDLTQGTSARVIAPSAFPAAGDVDEALRAARDAGATIVVFGQAQASDREVRLTGSVLDVPTGRPLGALKATGAANDLFHLEDALAGQIFTTLPRPLLTAQTLQAIQQQSQPGAASATPVNPLARPAPQPVQSPQQELPQQRAQPPVAPSPVYESTTAPPQPEQLDPQTYGPYGTAPAAAPVVSAPPVIVDGGPYVSSTYPDYGYPYCDTPIDNYYSAYTYASPGCDLWSGVTIGLGGYGCYGGYAGYGGNGWYGPGRGYYHTYGGYGFPGHSAHPAERGYHNFGYGGSHEYHGYGGGAGHEAGRSAPYPLARAESHGGGGYAASHFGSGGSGYARSGGYLSTGGPHTAFGGHESARPSGGGGYAGSAHGSSAGGSHGFSSSRGGSGSVSHASGGRR